MPNIRINASQLNASSGHIVINAHDLNTGKGAIVSDSLHHDGPLYKPGIVIDKLDDEELNISQHSEGGLYFFVSRPCKLRVRTSKSCTVTVSYDGCAPFTVNDTGGDETKEIH